MSLTRIHNLSISLDGFATGEPQSADAPFGHAGERLHQWMFATRFWQAGGTAGVDDAFSQQHSDGIGAEICLHSYLVSRGIEARILNTDPLPTRYAFLDTRGAVEVFDPARHDAFVRAADLIFMLDNSAPSRLGTVEAATHDATIDGRDSAALVLYSVGCVCTDMMCFSSDWTTST